MTVYYQPFDGAADGVDIEWTPSELYGDPVGRYTPGTGTAKFTTAETIRGTASARIVVGTGQNTAAVLRTLEADVASCRAHAYFRVPTSIPADGFQILNLQATTNPTHIVVRGDRSVAVESWGTVIGTASPAGTIPGAGTIVRVSVGATAGGTTTAAVYVDHSTTPIWSTSGPSLTSSAETFSEAQFGCPWLSTAGQALTIVLDDIRVETGAAAPLFAPEVSSTPTPDSWIREPVGWRKLGQPDATEERWQPLASSKIGAKRPGEGSYTIPGGAIYVATTGNDSTGTGAVQAPYATIPRAITAATAGTTIVLRAGNHRVGIPVPLNGTGYSSGTLWPGVTGNVADLTITGYPGEAAWLDGSTVHTGWTKTGSVWEKTYAATSDRSPTGTSGAEDYTDPNWRYVNDTYPRAAWPERVWIDGTELVQVANRAAVTAGTFAIEGGFNATTKLFTSTKWVIGENPDGHEIRLSDLATCMSSTGTGFTLRHVGIRRYANSICHRGAFKLRHVNSTLDNVTVEDVSTLGVTFYQAHTSVIKDCTFGRIGLLAIEGGESDDFLLTRCLIVDANRQHFNHAPESGGVKLTHLRRVIVSALTIYDSDCHGVWLDESVSQAVVTSCDINWVNGSGIVAELSGGATITNNVVTAPGSDCIVVFNMSNIVHVWHNTLNRPGRLSQYGRGVSIIADERAPLKAGSVGLDPRYGFPHPDGVDAQTVDVTVNNNLIGPSTAQGLLWNEDFNRSTSTARAYTQFGIKTARNLYVVRGNQPEWKWVLSSAGSAGPTILFNLGELQSRGLDAGSVVLTNDYGADVNGKQTSRAGSALNGVELPAVIATAMSLPVGTVLPVGADRRAVL